MAILKGNAIIGQSGGPTMVINESLVGIIEELKKYPEIGKIYGGLNGIKGMLEERFIDLGKESEANLEKVALTPAAALGSCRFKPKEEDCDRLFEILKKYDIKYFFYIGGNDSAETANIINEIAKKDNYELRVYHVPKTIDNDLRENDHTPGYASAAKYVISSFMGNDLDCTALPGVKFDIVMGRNAGWLTAAASLAKDPNDDTSGPHLIYVPERPVTINEIGMDILSVYERLGRCIVAVSEGTVDKYTGKPFADALIEEVDSHGNKQLSGTGALGDFFTVEIKAFALQNGAKNLRLRSDTLGYAQRSFVGVRSEVDANEARIVGREAAKQAVSGEADGSIAIKRVDNSPYRCEFVRVELHSVAKITRDLPEHFMNEQSNYVTDEFIEYMKPLVGELPVIGKLNKSIVKL